MEIRWKNNLTKAIGVSKITDDDEHVLKFVGYEPCEEENFTDNEYDGELVEVWKPIKKDVDEWFGVVRWCDDDIKNALEVQGYPVTENNIAKLRSICEHHSFTDYMIEQGWEYMYDSISNGDGWDEYDVEDVTKCKFNITEYECNKRIFRAEKMLERIKKEGLEHLLDDETVAFIKSLDGKEGTDYNWQAIVNDEPLVWIPADGDFQGTYVALCDCD